MAATITAASVCAGGGHLLGCTVDIDGTIVSLPPTSDASPLTVEEAEAVARYLVRRLRATGISPAALLGRVCLGDEATNVKMYTFFGPGVAITKTNIGTAYVNILSTGLNGERIVVDLTGCTQFRLLVSANLVGTGQWGVRVVRDGYSAVLAENANLGAAGERELDSDWTNLPAAFLGQGITLLRVQAKSTTGTDDPIFRRAQIGFR